MSISDTCCERQGGLPEVALKNGIMEKGKGRLGKTGRLVGIACEASKLKTADKGSICLLAP